VFAGVYINMTRSPLIDWGIDWLTEFAETGKPPLVTKAAIHKTDITRIIIFFIDNYPPLTIYLSFY
jgi:hypothetical protein